MKSTGFYSFIGKLMIMIILLPFTGCKEKGSIKESFSVAFLTDIHLQPEGDAVKGFSQALDTINKLNPDFIITGGDLIMDALGQSFGRADSLYMLYDEVIKKTNIKVYNTMGNHEIYGIYKSSGADPSNQEYSEKMFEKRLGNSYYSFEHKGWKFMIINSIEDTRKGKYVGLVDSVQFSWIESELKKTDPATPIVISTHIPFITANTQKYEGSTIASDSSTVVSNSRDIIDLFKGYNLKLVLQGHLHTVEDIYIDNVHFITGGAISAGWWKGPNRGFEEGFVYLTFQPDDFQWRYVDYRWEVEK
jgi:3',5'-cyclic AMP phosphodiesterase CpdA